MTFKVLRRTALGLAGAAILAAGLSTAARAEDSWKPSGPVNLILHTKPRGRR
jgi:hypothetical protein